LLSESESVWDSEGTWRDGGGEKGFIAAVEELGKRPCGCGFFRITLCSMYIEASVCLTFPERYLLPDMHGI
jgi:hypothetical protein